MTGYILHFKKTGPQCGEWVAGSESGGGEIR